MDKKLKAKWVKALRSGEYMQTTGRLYENGAYCCLGVLHKLMKGKNPPGGWDGEDSPETCEPKHGIPPDHKSALIGMNDGTGKYRPHSFAEIADYIEKNL